MNLDEFLQRRRQSWQQLEGLLDRANRDLSRMSQQDIDQLGQLYRLTTSDLALAQRDFPGQKVTVYLNQLVGRAHWAIYRGEPMRWRGVTLFFRQTFPRLYRALLPYTTLAFALFVAAAAAAFVVVAINPDALYVLEGPAIRPLVREVENGKLWTEIAPSVRSAASAFILTNNIRVTFIAFAGGITGGLLTAWILLQNGLHLGAIFGLLAAHDLAAGLAEFVVAHGFIELSVIFAAGGCGLYMGDGLVRPGLLSRRDALVLRGRVAVRIILGCAPLLVIAGLIEGFISPSGLPWPIKLAIGLATGAALHLYWLTAGRPADSRAVYWQGATDADRAL